MSITTKLQPVLIIAAALIGLSLGYLSPLGAFSIHLIEPFLMVLLFFVFLSVDGQKLKDSFKNIKFTLSSLVVNFLWTPIFAFGLGAVFFQDSADLQMGLLMLLVTPCTDWYLVFTDIADGNVELGASILPLNLLLQILLLPVYLVVFFGRTADFGIASTFVSITIVLIIPFSLSFLVKFFEKRWPVLMQAAAKLQSNSDHMQLLFLCLAVIAMFASESKNVFENPILLLRMLLPFAIFFAITFLLVRLVGKVEQLPYSDMTALHFTTLARNSPLSLAIAVAAFPDRPLIALALVIGPLIELPVLSVIAAIIKKNKE